MVFLPIVFAIYWLIGGKNRKYQNIFILISSYVFYGWWDYRFLSLIAFSSIIDFITGNKIYKNIKPTNKRNWLLVSITVNLGLLGIFKYYNFFVQSWIDIWHTIGYDVSPYTIRVILPVGISFYTFQTLSYSIDIYRGKIKPTNDFIAFATFVSFFPQLVAGPIERAKNLLPQFSVPRVFTYEQISPGIKLIIWGFFLKLVVADRCGIYVNYVYDNLYQHGGLSMIIATVLFAFQIYGDFAGYSLIAIGTSRLFGFEIMTNFRRPYYSASISEFWSRWHISLSTWFRDYLYIPLGGNRTTKHRWLFNLFITFLVSGLWHGANWTFIAWGALNGFFIILEAIFRKQRRSGIFNVFLTFIMINITWILFRSNSIGDFIYIMNMIVSSPGHLNAGPNGGAEIVALAYALLAIAILSIVEMKKEYFNDFFSLSQNKNEIVRMVYYAVLVFIILNLGVFGGGQFIYFQF
jgi:alginate O-acetyltransferase complex protein AlgI